MVAWAMARRCRIPIEYFATCFFDFGSSPTNLMLSSTCERSTRFLIFARYMRFRMPLYEGRNPGFSMTMPMSGGTSMSLPTRFPRTRISPSVRCISPQIDLKSTVFPEPLRPITPWIRPFSNDTVTSESAVDSLNFFVAFFTSIIAISTSQLRIDIQVSFSE